MGEALKGLEEGCLKLKLIPAFL